MTDRELAAAAIALMDGRKGVDASDCFALPGWETAIPDTQFVCDWRVAGALMERCAKESHVTHCLMARNGDFAVSSCIQVEDEEDGYDEGLFSVTGESHGDSLPRAIIEACVRALEKS